SCENEDLEKINTVGLKYQIFPKRIQNFECLSDEAKSKILWLLDKCPLLVLDNDVLTKAINFSNGERFIILGQSFAQFRNLSNLDPESQVCQKILDGFCVSLQGKKKLALRNLIQEDDFRIVSTD